MNLFQKIKEMRNTVRSKQSAAPVTPPQTAVPPETQEKDPRKLFLEFRCKASGYILNGSDSMDSDNIVHIVRDNPEVAQYLPETKGYMRGFMVDGMRLAMEKDEKLTDQFVKQFIETGSEGIAIESFVLANAHVKAEKLLPLLEAVAKDPAKMKNMDQYYQFNSPLSDLSAAHSYFGFAHDLIQRDPKLVDKVDKVVEEYKAKNPRLGELEAKMSDIGNLSKEERSDVGHFNNFYSFYEEAKGEAIEKNNRQSFSLPISKGKGITD